MENTYSQSTQEIQTLIDQTPRDGQWHDINGYAIQILDDVAGIYEPGSTQEGECDMYVRLS